MRTLRVRASGGAVSPLSLFRLRQFKDWPRVQAVALGDSGTPADEDFEVDVVDELAVARLGRFLDLEFRLTGVRLEILGERGWSPSLQR